MLLLVAAWLSVVQTVASLSTPCRWQLRASIGRAKGMATSMPDEWGRSGACLPISVCVRVLTTPPRLDDDRIVGASELETIRWG